MKLPGVLVVIGLIVPFPLYATKIQRLSMTDLRDRAASILVVDVIGVSTRPGPAAMVWTDYETRIVEIVRGRQRAGECLTLSFAGGSAAGLAIRIEGVPQLIDGARYLIFLDPTPLRPVPAIGWGQGLFRVTKTQQGERFVSELGERVAMAGGFLMRTRVPSDRSGAGRLANPAALNADGSRAEQQTAAQQSSDAPPLRDATMRDLQEFTRGAILERAEALP